MYSLAMCEFLTSGTSHAYSQEVRVLCREFVLFLTIDSPRTSVVLLKTDSRTAAHLWFVKVEIDCHSTHNHTSDSVVTSRNGNLGTIGPTSFILRVMLRIQKPARRKTGEGDVGGKTNASGAPW